MVKKSVKKKAEKSSQKKEVKTTKSNKKNASNLKNIIHDGINSSLFKKVLPIILILIVMYVAFQIRSGPINLDGLENSVRANTYSQIQQIIAQDVNTKYPNLAPNYKQELIQKEYQKVLETGRYSYGGQEIILEDLVKQKTDYIKGAFKDDKTNQTYLNAIDPYHFLGLASNYQKNGHTGTTLKNNSPLIEYKLAPNGVIGTYNPDFHTWLEAKLFSFNGLDENATIGEKTKAVYLIPVFLVLLSVIPTFFILRLFTNDIFAFIGSLFLVSIGTYVSRTIAGFVDTDGYVVLFPLIIAAFLIYSFLYENKIKTIVLALLAGFFQGMFLWAWGPGWFILVFASLALLSYVGYLLIVNIYEKKSIKNISKILTNDLLVFIPYILSSILFTYFFIKANLFSLVYNGIFSSISGIAEVSQTNIWPNVLSSVAELNSASFLSIIQSVGGKLVFLIAVMGILALSLDFNSKFKKDSRYKSLLIIFGLFWYASLIYFPDLISSLFTSLGFWILILGIEAIYLWNSFNKNFKEEKQLFYRNLGLILGLNVFIFLFNPETILSLTANNQIIFLGIFFIPIFISLLYSFISMNKSNKVFLTFLLLIWMAGTIYMSLNGVRFILLLGPAFAISVGVGLYYISKIINFYINKYFKFRCSIQKVLAGTIVSLLIFMYIFIPMFSQANAISQGTAPNFDDSWYAAMDKIKSETDKNTIITSWWDFGHFFATVSNRGVTFDGGSQTTPQSHWVGKLLLENDEKKSRDILRMLVCGGNKAFDIMYELKGNSLADSVKINKILYSTFGKSISETREILENNKYYSFTSEEVDKIMSYLACENPRENILITSGDMVGKAGVWAHWGSWDFTKKYVRDNYKKLSTEQIAQNIDENVSLIKKYISELEDIELQAKTMNRKEEDLLNQWFAPYLSYIPIQGQYEFPCELKENNILICQNSIQINLTNGKVSSSFNEVKFKNLVYPNRFNDLSVVSQNEKGDVDVLLIPSQTGFNVLLMQTPLGASLFTKLFYLDGIGTKYFEKFDDKQSVTGVRIKVWKTIFDDKNVSDITLNSISFNNVSQNQVESIIGDNLSNLS